jgi:type I restriction-modification system DNA methylase subunit
MTPLNKISLFNKKTIQKHLSHQTEIPSGHLVILENWVAQIKNGTLEKLNEIEVHASFTQQIMCKLLGYTAVGEGDSYTVAREYPVARGKVDLAIGEFCGDKDKDIVIAPFELKGAKTKNLDAMMSGRHKTPVQQAYEYARDIKGAKWVLLSNYVELRLYATSETSLVYEKFLFTDLLEPEEYAKFQLLLGHKNFLSGETEQLLKESEEADKDISNKLYSDYKALREQMLSHLVDDNPDYLPKQLITPAQKLLDRILFLSFAEDKGLIPDTSIKKAFDHIDPYNPHPIYRNIIGLFNSVDKGNSQLDIPAYNGGLFAPDKELDNLVVSDVLCEGFKNLAEYDFDSEVSVTILGHIFEQSIADLEILTESVESGSIPEPKQKTTSVSGNRKKHGVVYTPDNITQFIVTNTLGCHIQDQFELLFGDYGKYKKDGSIQWKKGTKTESRFWFAWQEKLQTIKVVDPACGSGAFLVAAFDCLYTEYEKTNDQIAELTGQRGILDLNKEILNNNLFGVDINEESVEITKLSLWLKTAERGKPLESLDANIVAGNSLGFDSPVPNNDFYWQQAFPDIFAEGGFDVVLGNPPYVRMELLKEIKPWLEQHYAVASDRLDLYGYFFELGLKILTTNGRMAYISSATFFKTGSGQNLRRYLVCNANLEKVIDFGDVQVFEGVTTYPAIIVLKKQQQDKPCKIEILSIKNKLPENIQIKFDQDKTSMPQNLLGYKNWKFEDESLHTLRKKLNEGHSSLKEVYGSPMYGIKTGCNEAFVINREIRDHLVQRDPKSIDVIKPFLEGKDLKQWHSQPRDLFIIYIPKNQIDIDDFPAIKEWLIPFKEKLEKRATKQAWFELQQAQFAYKTSFEKPKIQYGHFCPETLFHFNTNNAFSNDKSYIIPTSDLYLYGLLNSRIFWYLIKSICPFVRGGYYEVRAQYIETLPIPPKPKNESISILASEIQEKVEARYNCEIGFRRRLEDLCPEDETFKLNKKLESWWQLNFTDLQKEIKKAFKGVIPLSERNDWQDYFEAEQTKHQNMNIEISQLESQLNSEVYKLFKLKAKEISLIEADISH